jgi:hypothetical protein
MARAAIVTIQLSLVVKIAGFMVISRPLREINPAAGRLRLVFPVPLDHVPRLLHVWLLLVSLCGLSIATLSRRKLAGFLAYPKMTCRRPAWPPSSRFHLIMFRVCFFMSGSCAFLSVASVSQACLAENSPDFSPTRK